MNETIAETESGDIPPGMYYERNCFPEDMDVVNEKTGGRVVIIDDPSPKEFDIATTVLMPLNEELTEEGLIKRVLELHEKGWTLLFTRFDHAQGWRQTLFGRTLYRQMKHFKIFVGVTRGEKRFVHFFMVEKTPQFKRGVRKMLTHCKGVIGSQPDTEMFKRLFCVSDGGHMTTDESGVVALADGDDINFMGCAAVEDRVFQLNSILKTILE